MRSVTRIVACAVGALLCVSIPACSGESRRESPAGQPAAPAVESAARPAATSPSPPAATPATAPDSAQPARGVWTRVTVTDARVEPKDGQQVLTVKTRTPTQGWKLEVRPLPVSDPAVAEFEVVGLPPDDPAAATAEERTATCPANLGEKPNRPVFVHGAGAGIFAQ